MKMIGIVRRVDALGRIVLPKAFCNAFDIGQDTQVEILAYEDGMLIRKCRPGCLICGSEENIRTVMDKPFCESCLEKLRDAAP